MMMLHSTPSFFARAWTASRCSRADFSAFSVTCGAMASSSEFVSITDIAVSLFEHFFANLMDYPMAPSLNSDPSVARSNVSTRTVGQISTMIVFSFCKIMYIDLEHPS